MPAPFKLTIVAPDTTLFEGMVTSVVAPAHDGYMGVMARHEPIIAALQYGILEYEDVDGHRKHVWVDGGFFEVRDDQMTVLANTAERSTDIDLEHAQASLEKARRALRGETSDMTPLEASREIERAMNRIKAARQQ